MRGTKQRCGHAGSRQSDDQHAFAPQFKSTGHAIANVLSIPDYKNRVYLNFSVVNANSAKTSATIQKRTITFDSLQPSNSKW